MFVRYVGKIKYYEIWNEVDGESFSGSVADMITLASTGNSLISQ